MRTAAVLLCVVGLSAGLGAASVSLTQGQGQSQQPGARRDPLKVGPAIYTLVTENDRVRAMHATFPPGASIEMHDHPDHLSYVIKGGKIELQREGGDKEELEIREGEALWIPAEAHAARNTGNTEIKFLVVELKERPARGASPGRPSNAPAR